MNHFQPSLGSWVSGLATGSALLLVATSYAQPSLYEFGNPTAEEQLYIEYINRARANPTAEGVRLANTKDPAILNAFAQFNVDKVMLQAEFAAIPIAPPLAPSGPMTIAARGHSQYMLDNAVQTHLQNNPLSATWGQRVIAAGYTVGQPDPTIAYIGENVFAHCHSEYYGHAGLQVDWGIGGTGGMIAGRGHRGLIHWNSYREIGVGVKFGTNGDVGPQLVTQDIGVYHSNPTRRFATGVAYYDLNSNDFYDIGEGIPGLQVNVTPADWYCETAAGGGWVVRVGSAASNRIATFSKPGTSFSEVRDLILPSSVNFKLDLKLPYTPPAITSPASASAGLPHQLFYTSLGAATEYKWNRWTPVVAPTETCDDLNDVTVSTSSVYSVRNTVIKSGGAASFQLVNGVKPGIQTVELNSTYFGETSPSFSFHSRLRWATPSVIHKVQVRELGSVVWNDHYTQTNATSNQTENNFSVKNILLPQMAGKAFKVRFIASFVPGGTSFFNTGNDYGWFVDNITFSNVSKLTNLESEILTSPNGSFSPSTGTYVMSVNPVIGNVEFPAGYQTLSVTEAPPPPPVNSFSTWAVLLELSHLLPLGAIANDPVGDHDKDGIPNLIEFAFDSSPLVPNAPTPRMPKPVPSPTHFVLQYQRDTNLTGLILTPRASSDMSDWKSPGQNGAPEGFVDVLISTSGTIETREARIPLSSGSNWFMQMRVTEP